MTEDLRRRVEAAVGVSILGVVPVGGGCVASATRLDTSRGPLFLKWGAGTVGSTLAAEAQGLAALRSADTYGLTIPEVVHLSRGEPAFLIVGWLDATSPTAVFWERFGRSLARLHRVTEHRFGFGDDNWLGAGLQVNGWMRSWPDFFLTRRLGPQVARARDRGLWNPRWDRPYENLERGIQELLPDLDRGGLLHGDLWSGNFLACSDGTAGLVDPAVYFGDGWTDIAMADLFGGFDERFFRAYAEASPQAQGLDVRLAVYQLYHLLNHLNLFGAGYAGSVEAKLKKVAG